MPLQPVFAPIRARIRIHTTHPVSAQAARGGIFWDGRCRGLAESRRPWGTWASKIERRGRAAWGRGKCYAGATWWGRGIPAKPATMRGYARRRRRRRRDSDPTRLADTARGHTLSGRRRGGGGMGAPCHPDRIPTLRSVNGGVGGSRICADTDLTASKYTYLVVGK